MEQIIQQLPDRRPGQYVIPPEPTVAKVDPPINSQIQDDEIKQAKQSIQNSKKNEESVGETDVWAHLKSVAHRFQSNLQVLLTSDLRGREFLYGLCNLEKVNYSLIASILIDSEVKDNPDKRYLNCIILIIVLYSYSINHFFSLILVSIPEFQGIYSLIGLETL